MWDNWHSHVICFKNSHNECNYDIDHINKRLLKSGNIQIQYQKTTSMYMQWLVQKFIFAEAKYIITNENILA
jgi:hypothetical protein